MSNVMLPVGLIKPVPVPVETRTRDCGCGFCWVQVRVALENPRVARDIPYVQPPMRTTLTAGQQGLETCHISSPPVCFFSSYFIFYYWLLTVRNDDNYNYNDNNSTSMHPTTHANDTDSRTAGARDVTCLKPTGMFIYIYYFITDYLKLEWQQQLTTTTTTMTMTMMCLTTTKRAAAAITPSPPPFLSPQRIKPPPRHV